MNNLVMEKYKTQNDRNYETHEQDTTKKNYDRNK